VHKFDIKNQEDATELQRQNADRAYFAEKDATAERDTLDTGVDGVRELKSSISNNEKLFEERSTALKNHQLKVEKEVIEALNQKLSIIKMQKDNAKEGHEKLKNERIQKESEMKEEQEALEKQIKAHLSSIRANCETTQDQFEQCLRMIHKRNEDVSIGFT
jgi:hypothetical protein